MNNRLSVPRAVIAILLLVALTTIAVGAVAANYSAAPPLPVSTPVAPPDTPNPGPPLTDAERGEIKRQRGPAPDFGPHTAGSVIEIAGRPVQLPEDVSVFTIISTAYCAVGDPCLDTPAYVLQRGDAQVAVGKVSGRFAPGGVTSPAFDFVHEALR